MDRTGICCVLLSLLAMVTIHTCLGQKPDLVIRYGKSYPARPRPLPKSPFYAKRNEAFLPDNRADFSPEFPRDAGTEADKAVLDEFMETPFDFDPFSLWRTQRQRMTRSKFLRD